MRIKSRIERLAAAAGPWLKRKVAWLEDGGVASQMRWVLRVLVPLGPVLFDFGAVTARGWSSWIWVGGWLVAFLLLIVLEHYKDDAVLEKYMLPLARIQGAFAGSLENMGSYLGEGFMEAECRNVCTSIMHRIQDLACMLYEVPAQVRIRITLAVPQLDDTTGEMTRLRVWCYDQPYEDRKWSVLPLDHPGAPQAYLQNTLVIIPDILEDPVATRFYKRKFRSVVSIPVGGQAGGDPCAVLNIDATVPNFFTPQTVITESNMLILPMVQAIGVAIRSRKEDAVYAFNQ